MLGATAGLAGALAADGAARAAYWFAGALAAGMLRAAAEPSRAVAGGPKSGVDGETRAKLAVPAASSLAERNLSAQEGQFRASVGCLRA